ncbi:hypothetical protein DOM22_14975 [Bdellovibrio sp. ZAP7]|uniref:hypothetical protein n=1 Tax=Bdellovibrio sp. ZAP7 TaxID=2231053 RepID=UPI00116483DA|nr:hypothetical protein [Bdellovibrio sp. ZAP7]QDK46375.1 hypothetical protein DOM22_14975 [Bdellovibrio sp. ZAP7]
MASVSQAGPQDPSDYIAIKGGLVDIADGAYIEGSQRQGGIQPDYKIDLESAPLKQIMEKAASLREMNLEYWDRVGMVVEIIRGEVFSYTDYKNPYYRRLLKKYRLANEDIPLSEYALCSAGVCREHALILHFALKAAGIQNDFAYVSAARVHAFHQYVEDHAVTVVKLNGVEWVVDAYNELFNGYRLKDLMKMGGPDVRAERAPIAQEVSTVRFFRKIHDFPVVYNPKAGLCKSVFK